MLEKIAIHVEMIRQDGFTDRETEVIKEICQGHSDKQIATVLQASIYTINTHIKNIYQKTQLQNQANNTRCQLISLLVANNIIKITGVPYAH